jgi:pimeloyl-ACP methyl ester carboxylesterase
MKVYLCLHGAMRGAWLWERIRPIIEKAGATVIAYDLPGHGKRANERAGVTMSTYINDVLEYISKNSLKDLILVGHSMSGIIISRIAEEIPDRIEGLVYLAAVVPRDGDALIDLLTKERQETLRKLEGKVQELFGPIDALRPNYFTDLTGADQDIYLKQLSPQPLAVFFEKIPLKRFYSLSIPKTYVMGLRDKALPPDLTREFARRLGVTPVEIDAGHDMMVVRPEETAAALLRIPSQEK